jgi:hypothetical protein
VPRRFDEDVLRVAGTYDEPIGLVKRPRINATHFGEPLKSQIKFRFAYLSGNPDAPERRALLQLIGSLAASAGQDFEGDGNG